MDFAKSAADLEMERRAEDQGAARLVHVQERRLRLQSIEEKLRPVSELLAKRQKELTAARAVINNASMNTDPAELAQAMANEAALEKIVALVQGEFQSIDAAKQAAQNEFANSRRGLKTMPHARTAEK